MSSAACGSSSAGEAPSSWQREASKLRGWKDHVPLRVESLDWRCGAQVIGTVCEALPRFDGALAAHAIPRTRVLGVWTVPPPLLRHLDGGHAPWADVRPRLGPFVDSWPQLRRLSDRAAREPRDGGGGGAAAAGFDEAEWQAMGLLGENLLLVKHTLRPAQLAAQLSRRIRRQLATRRQLAKRLLREHPFLRPATAALLLRRALRRERAATKPYFEAVTASKVLWNELREKSCSAERRSSLVSDLHDELRGKYRDVALKHDASRLVQAVIQFGSEDQRMQLFHEMSVTPSFVGICRSPYAHYCITKLLENMR